MKPSHQRIAFKGSQGDELAARLDRPAGTPRATAIFAHCFTCSKDIAAARNIAAELAQQGIAVLRFDFTGLGGSSGEFANTNFTSNCQDLLHAAGWLRDNLAAPSVLIGHSLGGAAVLAVAGEIAEVKAVATVAAPADAEHVIKNFKADLRAIEKTGAAEVSLAGRSFRIRRQFLNDIRGHDLEQRIAALKKPLLVLHSPLDEVVGIDNASRIFTAARHPKSFISLDTADHLLSDPGDAAYAAQVVAAWASRYIGPAEEEEVEGHAVRVAETGAGGFQNHVIAGRHRLFADEPVTAGGLDSGLSPYQFLSAALAACTSMTLRMYASHKHVQLGDIAVEVSHGKLHARDCVDCAEEIRDRPGRIDRFERTISIAGEVDAELQKKLLEIADKCPVHRTLEASSAIVSRLAAE